MKPPQSFSIFVNAANNVSVLYPSSDYLSEKEVTLTDQISRGLDLEGFL